MSDLHANITPPEDENEEPTVSIAALTRFVDSHAELLYERQQNNLWPT